MKKKKLNKTSEIENIEQGNPDSFVAKNLDNNGVANNEEVIESEIANIEAEVKNESLNNDGLIIDADIVSERLEEVEKTKEPKKKKSSMIWNIVFLVINLLFMFFVVKNLLAESSGATLAGVVAMQGKKLYWLLAALACFLGVYVVNTLSMCVFLKNTTGKYRFWLCVKVTILGRYYDYITPMAVGGQPSQILNLVKGGVTPGVATSIPIIKMIINQLVRWTLIIVIFIFLVPKIPTESGLMNMLMDLLKILGFLGIIVTTIVSLGFLFLGSSKIVGKKIAKLTIRIGYRLKIVKNYRKSYDKFMRQVLEYQNSMRYLAKNKSVLIKSVLYSIIDFLLYCSIGFFTSLAFSQSVTITNFAVGISMWLISLARYQVVDMASAIMVLPGGTGIKEIAFLIMFNFFFRNTNMVTWSFLSWRVLDYYLYLAIGFVFIIVQTIMRASKARKERKQELNS